MILDEPIPAPVAERPQHAKNRPPSAADRWLSCPASVSVQQLYDNDQTEASTKGDAAHDLLENGILWGILPDTHDADMDLNIRGVLEWVNQQRLEYGKGCQLFAEKVYDIPETGEYGTADITFVTRNTIHIAEYKDGFVPVDVYPNGQMILYLLGAIALYGERAHYKITVLQPNYHHRDGPYRTVTISNETLEWYRGEIAYALKYEDEFVAGKHCKKTYCPHRGNCLTFMSWARTDARLAWWPSDVNALDDVQLSQALDHAEILQGIRDELRKEAMRRALNMDKHIPGYKVVRSRVDRSFKSDTARDEAFKVCRDLGATDEQLYSRKPEGVAGIERFFKEKFKHFGPGKWSMAFDQQVQPHIRDFSGSLTLARDTDGRPAHTRGIEFGNITSVLGPKVEQVI